MRNEKHDVLVLEFTGLSVEQKFGQVLRGVQPVRIDPLAADLRAATSDLPVLADRIRDRLPTGPPDFILAYCTAAPLALQVAAACYRHDRVWPHTVLFDPDSGSAADLRREFGILYRNLGADPEPVLARSAHEEGGELMTTLQRELLGLRADLVALYGGDTDAEELVDHLLTRYRDWLLFLWHASTTPPVHSAGPVSVITAKAAGDLGSLLADPDAAVVRHCHTDGRPVLVSEPAEQALHEILAAVG